MTQYDGRIPPPPRAHTWAYEHSLPYISLCFNRSPTSKEYVDNISVTISGSLHECSPTILMKISLLKEIDIIINRALCDITVMHKYHIFTYYIKLYHKSYQIKQYHKVTDSDKTVEVKDKESQKAKQQTERLRERNIEEIK